MLLFLAICIFGGLCWDRDWLLYPNYNYVSWSYALATFSTLGHIIAASFLFFVSTLTFQIEHTARKKLTRLKNSIKYPFKPKILNHNARYQLPLCHVLFLCL